MTSAFLGSATVLPVSRADGIYLQKVYNDFFVVPPLPIYKTLLMFHIFSVLSQYLICIGAIHGYF